MGEDNLNKKYCIGEFADVKLLDGNENVIFAGRCRSCEISTNMTDIKPLNTITQFKIQKAYEIDDTNFSCDLMEARLFNNITGELIMSGDYYHNKIEERIEGFFEALKYLGIDYKVITENINEEF